MVSSREGHLEVRLDGQALAALEGRGMGFVPLRFTNEALETYGPGARVLSISLPLTEHVPAETATQFFRGLLPEGLALERGARHLRLSANDTFGLLRELGRVSAGALVIATPGEAL